MIPRTRIKSSPHLDNTLYWYISGLCNLRCSFCTLSPNSSQVKQEVAWTLSQSEILQEKFNDLPGSWEFFIGGGEPFAFPSFLKIVEGLVASGHHISVATNFTMSFPALEKFFEIVENKICLFLASFKPGIHGFESFLTKAAYANSMVQQSGGHFSVGTVARKQDLEYAFEKGKSFIGNGIDFALQVEKIDGQYREYAPAEKKKIIQFGRTFGLDKNNEFKGKTCLAGINYFVLLPGGHVFRCHSAICNPDREKSYLGNIVDGSFRLFRKPQKCTYAFCNCVNAYNKNLISDVDNVESIAIKTNIDN